MSPLTNIEGGPFDFQKWRSWLEQRGEGLLAEGYEVKYGFTDAHSSPKANLGVSSAVTVGYFTSWSAGYCDFEVLDKGSGRRLVDRMGLILEDSTFEAAFQDFQKHMKL